MQTPRTYSWIYSSAAALVVAQVALCVPLYVNAAATTGAASALVLTQPTALSTISIFSVSTTGAQPKARTINAKPKNAVRSALALPSGGGDTIQPAVFSIAGLPTQTFSIVMPAAGVAPTTGGSVEFMNFAHNAGSTPTISASGSTRFSVGANMRFTPSSGISVTKPQVQGSEQAQDKPNQTSAQKAGLPRPNPFGVQGVQDGFMNVLVSYN